MMREGGDSAWDTLTAYAQVVRRRWWVVVLTAVLVPLAVVFLSKLQDPVYEASADVLVSRENLAATLGSAPDTLASSDPKRFMQTQAGLARTTEVAEGTLELTNPSGLTPGEFLAASSVRAVTDSDLLVFSTRAPIPSDAAALADAYARSYTQYRNALDTAPLRRALESVTKRIATLRRTGETNSAFFSALLDKQQQLQTIVALRTDTATLVQPAVGATQISPQTRRWAQLALVFGLFGGLALAFLLEASDRRLRSPHVLPERLQLPILGRVPRHAAHDELSAMTRPSSELAEAYRMLRLNVEFATADRAVRTVLVTSAVEGEGKTTTAANLAITLARAGRNVVLVDADYLRPAQAKLFSVPAAPGLVQVANGDVLLNRALTTIRMPDPVPEDTESAGAPALTLMSPAERRHAATERSNAPEAVGRLRLLPTEEAPLDSADAMVSSELRRVLDQLEADADLVIIDAPPLGTSVTLWLGSLVDGVLVVANGQLLRESMLDELVHSLDELPAEKLGLVLTAVSWYPRRGYGYRRQRPQVQQPPLTVEQSRRVASSDRGT